MKFSLRSIGRSIPSFSSTRRRQLFLESLEPRQLLATFTVNTTADTVDAIPGDGLAQDASGNTSLRAAIMEANASVGADLIEVPAGQYELSIAGTGENGAARGDLDIGQPLTIRGAGIGATVVDGKQLDRVFDLVSNVALTLTEFTVAGGRVPSDNGGGLRNRGAATIRQMAFVGNHADLDGGGIESQVFGTSLHIAESIFDGNTANRYGGGVGAEGGTLLIESSTFQNNQAFGGGGVDVASFNSIVKTSTFHNNLARNNGGGIYLKATTDLMQSTFTNNSAAFGGGIYVGGSTIGTNDVVNNTLVGNIATELGGGIAHQGWCNYINNTLTGNHAVNGGGIGTVSGDPDSLLVNNVIAQNTVSFNGPDAYGTFPSGGYNFIGAVNGSSGFNKPGDQIGSIGSPIDPLLGPLQNNGGLTQTRAPLAGSRTIDRGTGTGAPDIDQRGQPRPAGPAVDIGAVEEQNEAPVASGQGFSLDEDTEYQGQLQATDPDGDPLAYEITRLPVHGTITLGANGAFTYEPHADFFGFDNFQFRVSDGTLYSNTAHVSIGIRAVQDAPVAYDDAYATQEDQPLVIRGAVNTAGDSLRLRYAFDESDAGNAPAIDTGAAPATDGTLVNLASRTGQTLGGRSLGALDLTGDPAGTSFVSAGDVDELDGLEEMTVTMWINLRGDPQTADVLVADVPSIEPEFPAAGSTGWRLSIGDPAPGIPLRADQFSLKFQILEASSGSVNIQGSNTSVGFDADQQWAFIAVTYNVNDPRVSPGQAFVSLYRGSEASAPDVVSGSIFSRLLTGFNVAPLTFGGSDGRLSFTEDDDSTPPAWMDEVRIYNRSLSPEELDQIRLESSLLLDGVTINDVDVDREVLTAIVVDGPLHGQLSLAPNGAFVYTPDADYAGSDQFTYRVNDGALDSNVATVSITVHPVNDAPLAGHAAAILPENSPAGTAVIAVAASDVDPGQSLSFKFTAGNDGGAFAIDGAGNITVANSAALDFESQQQWVMTVEVRDNGTPELAALATVTIDLTNVIETTTVPIDILPGKSPNVIDIRKGGKVSVAILSTATFDAATMVDVESLSFGRTGDELSLVRRGKAKTPVVSLQDVNGDGRLDLVPQFDIALAGFQAGDTEGILRGLIVGGELLEGRDSVEIRAGGGKNPNAANWAMAVDAFYAELADGPRGWKKSR